MNESLKVSKSGDDIILSNGKSVYEKYFKPKNLAITNIIKLNNDVYFCRDIEKMLGIIVSEKYDGEVFPMYLRYARCPSEYDKKSKYIVIERDRDYNEDRRYNILDENGDVILPTWKSQIKTSYDLNTFIIVDDNQRQSLYNAEKRRHITAHNYSWITPLDSHKPYFIMEDDDFCELVDKNGRYITGNWKIEENTLTFEEDLFSDKYVETDVIISRSKIERYDEPDDEENELYVFDKEGNIKSFKTGIEEYEDEYTLIESIHHLDEEMSDYFHFIICVEKGNETYYNYINRDGELLFEKWVDGISYNYEKCPKMICNMPVFEVKRDGKHNFVSMKSYIPFFDENEWIDEWKIINIMTEEEHKILAIARNGKYNLMDIESDPYRLTDIVLLDKWCDELYIGEDDKQLYIRYGEDYYLYWNGELFRGNSSYKFSDNYELISTSDYKWNMFNTSDESPELIFDQNYVDGISYFENNYVIVRKNSKLTYYDLNEDRYLFWKLSLPDKVIETLENTFGTLNFNPDNTLWFDDVEPVENDEIKVTLNGKTLTFNTKDF